MLKKFVIQNNNSLILLNVDKTGTAVYFDLQIGVTLHLYVFSLAQIGTHRNTFNITSRKKKNYMHKSEI
jgi:hypothetical protein